MDILNLMKEFPNQESCLRFIEEKRWKDGVCCIHISRLGVLCLCYT